MMTNNLPAKAIIRSQYLGEPPLEFANEREHVDPKLGIARFGPKSLDSPSRHPSRLRIGFIGTAETTQAAHDWMQRSAEGVLGDEDHPAFPGYMADRGFLAQMDFDGDWNAQLDQQEVERLLKVRGARDRFEEVLGQLEYKLRFLSQKDLPPQYVVVALPDLLFQKSRVANYIDKDVGEIHRDLRKAFKAVAMQYRIPTQLLRQQTVDGREKDHPSKVTWNFFSGMYFKAGGVPWGPTGLTPGTCYLGIGFYRALGTYSSTIYSSLIQAFDEHGDGLVLRGPEFNWNSRQEGSRSPHLSEEQANHLLDVALARYSQEMGQTPQRVVVHKSSRFWAAESDGFRSAMANKIKRFDLVALDTRQSTARLLTTSTYPPLRGTRFTVGDLDYLYTTGFISELGQYHSMHVPSPILVTDHVGQDTSRETLLREILILTKMNWNSARLGGKSPITLKFSDLVGEIMREIPADQDPLPQFKFYM